jgi:hypothetical protein
VSTYRTENDVSIYSELGLLLQHNSNTTITMFSAFLSSSSTHYPAATVSSSASAALLGQHSLATTAAARQMIGPRYLSSPALHPHHSPPPSPLRRWLQKAALPTAATLLCAALVAAAILYAPLNDFDDLDCLSECEQCCIEGRSRRDRQEQRGTSSALL